jgi:flagellar biosynthesis/type III secretory pathway protein FliH
MELNNAVEILKAYKDGKTILADVRVIYEAIDVVLDKLEITTAMKETAFEEGYRKGKQNGVDEGFHSGFAMGLKRGTEITKEVE